MVATASVRFTSSSINEQYARNVDPQQQERSKQWINEHLRQNKK
jgi:hypothetical protein